MWAELGRRFEGYGWMHAIGAAYVVAVGIGSVAAYLAEGLYLRAVICAGAQVIGIAFMVLSRRAFGSGAWFTGAVMMIAGLACCSVAAFGIQHAWEADGGALPYAAAWFISATELILFVGIDHIADVQATTIREAREKAEQERAEDQRRAEERARDAEHRRRIEEMQAAAKVAAAAGQPDRSGFLADLARSPAAQVAAGVAGLAAFGPAVAGQTAAAQTEPATRAARPEDGVALAKRLIAAENISSRNALVRRVAEVSAGQATISKAKAAAVLDQLQPNWRTRTPAEEPLAA